MGETPDDIKQEIEQARERLGANLNQLEYQREAARLDWRVVFRPQSRLRSSAALSGSAFLIGWMVTARPESR